MAHQKSGSIIRGMVLGCIFFVLLALSVNVAMEMIIANQQDNPDSLLTPDTLVKLLLIGCGFISGIFAAFVARYRELRAGIFLGLVCTLLMYLAIYMDNPTQFRRLSYHEMATTLGLITLGTLAGSVIIKILMRKKIEGM